MDLGDVLWLEATEMGEHTVQFSPTLYLVSMGSLAGPIICDATSLLFDKGLPNAFVG